jgi:histone H2A
VSVAFACHFVFFLFIYRIFLRLGKLLGDVVISQGGVGQYWSDVLFYLISDPLVAVPHIAPELLPTKTGKGKKESQEA